MIKQASIIFFALILCSGCSIVGLVVGAELDDALGTDDLSGKLFKEGLESDKEEFQYQRRSLYDIPCEENPRCYKEEY